MPFVSEIAEGGWHDRFKVLLIVALVIPLIYISAVMMNSILDEVLKDKKDTKEKKDREK